MVIPIYFTLEFGKHLFHFCFLHYYCLGITRKLCEQLSTYPSNDPTTLNLWLRIQSFGCKKTCLFFSANVLSFNKLLRYENYDLPWNLVRRFLKCQTVWGNSVFRNRIKPDKQTMQENWKATNGNIKKSPHDFEDQPGRSMLIPIFSKEHCLIGNFAPQSVYD